MVNGRLSEEQAESSSSETEWQGPLAFTSRIRGARQRRDIIGAGGLSGGGRDRDRERRYTDDEELDGTNRRAFVDEVNVALRRPMKRRSIRALDRDESDDPVGSRVALQDFLTYACSSFCPPE